MPKDIFGGTMFKNGQIDRKKVIDALTTLLLEWEEAADGEPLDQVYGSVGLLLDDIALSIGIELDEIFSRLILEK
jgi:hypothetical protein